MIIVGFVFMCVTSQAQLTRYYDEEKEKLKADVTQAIASETERCQECVRDAVTSERERGQQLSADVLTKAEEHVKSYIEQHKQVRAYLHVVWPHHL